MHSWAHHSLVVKDTPRNGRGVFITEALAKDALLMVFGGHVLTFEEEASLPERIRDVSIQIDRGLVLGIVKTEELSAADFVNHSCDPNTGIKGQISLVSIRDLHAGEEITFDYGTALYRVGGALPYALACNCGASLCRGKITHNDWRCPELQKKYQGYFPYYLQEEIQKLKSATPDSFVYVAPCELGKGVFAKKAIAQGEEFLVLEGEVISFEEVRKRGEAEGNPIQIGDDHYLDVVSPGVYLNHSCNPNTGIVRDHVLMALRDITAGEEVRIDYSTTMQENSWTMECRCGDQDCRGKITDFRLLPKAVRERYLARGVVQTFIRNPNSFEANSILHNRSESLRAVET